MSIADEVTSRPADPVKDLAYAYDVFKRTISPYVIALAGYYPEQQRYDFFKKGFEDPDMQMIVHNGKDIGCFCISDTPSAIVLQRMYFEPSYQRQGIGQRIMGLALQMAHDSKKTLELEVLENNTPAISAYTKNGFTAYQLVVNDWNRKLLMRHKDTVQYLPRPAPALQPF